MGVRERAEANSTPEPVTDGLTVRNLFNGIAGKGTGVQLEGLLHAVAGET